MGESKVFAGKIVKLGIAVGIVGTCFGHAFAETCAPDNLGEHKSKLAAYKTSGRYDTDLAAVAAEAKQYLQERLGKVDKPAIVFDVDETALSNYPALKINDYGFIINGACDLDKGPCGFLAWIDLAKGTAIASTMELYRFARENNVAVFFITGRPERTREATEKNLREAGYDIWEKAVLKPNDMKVPSAADYKGPVRCELVAQGYNIVLNMGDQPSDLAGGCAEKTFLLPNPFYRIP